MKPRDKIIKWAVNAGFHLSLFGFISVIGLVTTFASPKPLKQALKDSGAYDKFVGALVDQSAGANQKSSVPLDDPQVRKIIEQSFSPQLLKQSTESVIDASYDWAYGRSDSIRFRVDLTDSKRQLANQLSTYAFDRIQALPDCQGQVTSYDPFTANCRIFFESDLVEQAKLTNDIYNNQDVLPNPLITDASLPKTSDGQRLDQAYSFVPKVMPALSGLPYILGGLAALFGLALVRLNDKSRAGVRQVAGGLFSDAGFLGFSTIIFGKLLPVVAPGLSLQLQGSDVQSVLNSPFQIISDRIENTLLLTCFGLLVTGVCMLLLERGTRPYSPYLDTERRSGLAAAGVKIRPLPAGAKLKPKEAPVVSSEQAEKHTKRRVKNKKYRKIKL